MMTVASRHSDGIADHRYVWSFNDVEEVFRRPLYREIIASKAFQRLNDVRFLGAIDYLVHPSGSQLHRRRHTRFEHTLGVAQLALSYSQLLGLNDREEMLLTSAALLHDIGHSPLSHSLETAFRAAFGLDHHQAGINLVQGTSSSGESIIPKLLRSSGLDPVEVTALFSGSPDAAHSILFRHPINIDTIEGISRSQTYIMRNPVSPPPQVILFALINPNDNVSVLDNFWLLKDVIYTYLVQGLVGLMADLTAKRYVENHPSKFSPDDFYKTERQLRQSAPGLFVALDRARNTVARLQGKPRHLKLKQENIIVRRFYLDEQKPSGDPARYLQSKSQQLFELIDPLQFDVDKEPEAKISKLGL